MKKLNNPNDAFWMRLLARTEDVHARTMKIAKKEGVAHKSFSFSALNNMSAKAKVKVLANATDALQRQVFSHQRKYSGLQRMSSKKYDWWQ